MQWLSLICGFRCVVKCKFFLCMTRPRVYKNLIKSCLTMLIFFLTLHLLYKNIQFSRHYNQLRNSYEYYLSKHKNIGALFFKTNSTTKSAGDAHFNVSDQNVNHYHQNDPLIKLLDSNLEHCPDTSPSLQGKIPVIYPHRVVHIAKNVTKLMTEIAESNPDVDVGGYWYPRSCSPIYHVAVIVPYRNRSEHLALLLQQLHLVLKRQLLHYHIFVIEQEYPELFNKAFLMNIAYANISKTFTFDCYIFHDVDLLLENDRNLYNCERSPIHLSPAVDTLQYKLPYQQLIGGVLAIKPEQFEIVNGYSNLYWGWGGEDDDLYYRLEQANITVYRPSLKIGRYRMLRHLHQVEMDQKKKFTLVWSAKDRYFEDGLDQLPYLNYSIVASRKEKLYTHITVNLGNQPAEDTKLFEG